jgi:hypothetical protein
MASKAFGQTFRRGGIRARRRWRFAPSLPRDAEQATVGFFVGLF